MSSCGQHTRDTWVCVSYGERPLPEASRWPEGETRPRRGGFQGLRSPGSDRPWSWGEKHLPVCRDPAGWAPRSALASLGNFILGLSTSHGLGCRMVSPGAAFPQHVQDPGPGSDP